MTNNLNKNIQQPISIPLKGEKPEKTFGLQKEVKIWTEGKIIRCKFFGDQDKQLAKEFMEKTLEALDLVGGQRKVLVDGRGGAKWLDIKARKIYAEFGERAEIDKLAVFGLSTIQGVLGSFLIAVIKSKTNIKEIKFFKTEEEALKWLKEE